MEYLAEKLTNYIFKQKVISNDNYEIYKYGLQTGMETGVCIIVSALIAVCLKMFITYMVCIGMFFPLRAYVNGFHMKKFYSCFICSCTVIIAGLYFSIKWTMSVNHMIIPIFILILLIHRLAYITTRRQADEEEVKFYALQRKRIFLVLIVCLMFFWGLQMEKYISLMLYVLSVVLISIVMEIMVNKR